MAVVRQLEFLIFKNLLVTAVNRPCLHRRAKFRQDRLNHCIHSGSLSRVQASALGKGGNVTV